MEGSSQLPPNLKGKLAQYRNASRQVKLVEWAVASLFGLLFSYCAAYGLDRVTDTAPVLRLAILVAGTSGITLFFPMLAHNWFWKLRHDAQVAKVIRKSMPRFGDQLLGTVELARGNQPNASPALVRAALVQMDTEAKDKDLSPALPKSATSGWTLSILPLVCMGTAMAILNPDAAYNAFLRWSNPLADIHRYTFTSLEPLPSEMVVAFAEPFTVKVRLKPESKAMPPVATARYGIQRPLEAKISGGKPTYRFDVPPQRDAGILAVTAGDDTALVRIRPTLRPELLSLDASIRLPEYLRYEDIQKQDARTGTILLLKGSEYQIHAKFTRPCQSASFGGKHVPPSNGGVTTAWETPGQGGARVLDWRDQFGLEPVAPFQLTTTLTEDAPPSIIIRNNKREQFLLTSESLSLDLSVTDDYGIQHTGISWEGVLDPIENPTPHKGEKPTAPGAPTTRTLQVHTSFNPSHLGIPPQTIHLRAYAEDFFQPSRRTYSPQIVLHVLDPEQHALHVTGLYSKWQRRTLEIYERERQLNDRNKSLRALPVEQLANPANQRSIAEQARAEMQNAQKLEEHTQSGEDLLQQAARNPNFEGDQLEKWADTLQALKDIAKNRMPTVADLLQKASEEAGNPKVPASGESPPSVTNDQSNQAGIEGKSNGKDKPKLPSIKDIESSLAANNQQGQPQNNGSKPSANSRLGLPVTTNPGKSGGQEGEENQAVGEANENKESLDEAVENQEELLKQFADVTEALNAILKDLEGSTFVKRLKAASRTQLQIAATLNSKALGSFGLAPENITETLAVETKTISYKQAGQGRVISDFLEDLDAYCARVGQPLYEDILTQMEDSDIQPQLIGISEHLANGNHSGNSISASEYWADQFDIWADQLVDANDQSAKKGRPAKKKPGNLPPELILAVMRILHEETDLREDTRAAELARNALDEDGYAGLVLPLQETQYNLAARTKGVVEAIQKLPKAQEFFSNELGLLNKVQEVMFDAEKILGEPNTGPDAIGAETEAIELLLQAKRACNKGSGGGGPGNSPGGGGIGTTKRSALAMVGEGDDKSAKVKKRKVGQSTGTSGATLPAEYKNGLDAYFHALENL